MRRQTVNYTTRPLSHVMSNRFAVLKEIITSLMCWISHNKKHSLDMPDIPADAVATFILNVRGTR
jgi:hypothetical protein